MSQWDPSPQEVMQGDADPLLVGPDQRDVPLVAGAGSCAGLRGGASLPHRLCSWEAKAVHRIGTGEILLMPPSLALPST